MALKVCAEPGCPTLCTTSRCADCTRAKDKARGTRQERGYDAAHYKLRAQLLPDAYGTRCLHCEQYMWPHEDLALDHTEDRTGYRGIVHASCNSREGAIRGNKMRS